MGDRHTDHPELRFRECARQGEIFQRAFERHKPPHPQERDGGVPLASRRRREALDDNGLPSEHRSAEFNLLFCLNHDRICQSHSQLKQ